MLNVNQITSQLAKMPDPALQKYAAMHKNDPYILALAISESNRRKELRGAAQQAHGGQQAPKVVDQELAQMAQPMPEEVGIGALPAENMQGMAAGGIVAFEGGGEVPRFNGQFGSSVYQDVYNMTPEQVKEAAARKLRMEAARAGLSGAEAAGAATKTPSLWEAAKSGLSRFSPAGLAGWGFGTYHGDLNANEEAELKKRWDAYNKSDSFEIPESTFKSTGDTSEVDKMAADLAAKQTGAAKPDTKKAPPALPTDQGGIKTLVPGGSNSPLFQKEVMPTKEDYNKEYDMLYKSLDEKNAKFLEGQKSKLKTDREEALYMSMIKGGLAAAAGTSKNALQNIAKGFGEGAEDFGTSLKEFRKAAQETAKAEIEMERAQADRRAGRLDKYDARMDRVKDRQLEADKAILSANTTLQAASTTAGAHLAAAKLPSKEVQMAMMYAPTHGADGKPLSPEQRFQAGYPKLVEAQSDKFSPAAAYAKYMNSYDENKTTRPFLSFPEFLQTFGYGGGAQPGKGATIRANPEMGG